MLTVADKAFPTLDEGSAEAMIACIQAAKDDNDSIGGQVEVVTYGFPMGVGAPFFGGIEPQLACWFYAIPAVKGVSFGSGFSVAALRGSEYNDALSFAEDGTIHMLTNRAGGADGGISTGMPIIAQLAFRPTASIGKEQQTVDLDRRENTVIRVKGRHDPCIVPRAVPVAESVMAIALLDLLLLSGNI